jgi:hypothetical protein
MGEAVNTHDIWLELVRLCGGRQYPALEKYLKDAPTLCGAKQEPWREADEVGEITDCPECLKKL